jgi:hypothetical protein
VATAALLAHLEQHPEDAERLMSRGGEQVVQVGAAPARAPQGGGRWSAAAQCPPPAPPSPLSYPRPLQALLASPHEAAATAGLDVLGFLCGGAGRPGSSAAPGTEGPGAAALRAMVASAAGLAEASPALGEARPALPAPLACPAPRHTGQTPHSAALPLLPRLPPPTAHCAPPQA